MGNRNSIFLPGDLVMIREASRRINVTQEGDIYIKDDQIHFDLEGLDEHDQYALQQRNLNMEQLDEKSETTNIKKDQQGTDRDQNSEKEENGKDNNKEIHEDEEKDGEKQEKEDDEEKEKDIIWEVIHFDEREMRASIKRYSSNNTLDKNKVDAITKQLTNEQEAITPSSTNITNETLTTQSFQEKQRESKLEEKHKKGEPLQIISIPTEYLRLIKDEKSKERRKTYKLQTTYKAACKHHSTIPIPKITLLYQKAIRLGEKIQYLSLDHMHIANSDVYPITQLLNSESNLVKLDLNHNQIEGEGIKPFTRVLKYNVSTLTELNLSYNPLGETGAQELAQILPYNQHLLVLNLEATQLTTKGSKTLITSLLPSKGSKSRLVKLNLKYDGVDNDCITSLLQLAQETKHICFLELYPPSHDHDTQDAWLNIKGWHDHSKLRDTCQSNMTFCRMHPEVFEFQSKSSMTSFFDYLTDSLSPERLKNNHNSLEISTSQDRLSGEWVVCAPVSNPKQNKIASTLGGENDAKIDQDLFSLRSLKYRHRSSASYESLKLAMETPTESPNISGPLMECGICFEEDLTPEQMYIIDECHHKFCWDCMKTYVQTKICSAETDKIKCPECDRHMKVPEIIQIIRMCNDESLLEKYEKFSLSKALSSMENLIRCPNVTCNNAMIVSKKQVSQPKNNFHSQSSSQSNPFLSSTNYHPNYGKHQYDFYVSDSDDVSEEEDNNVENTATIVCTACSTHICSDCGEEQHHGYSCEAAKLKKHDSSFEEAKKKYGIKSCPGCGADTQQNNGCNHMTCVRCGTHWCWNCQKNLGKDKNYKVHFSVTDLFGGCPKWYYSNLMPGKT